MNVDYGIISFIPVILTLIIAFWKKNVFVALLAGIFSGSIIISIYTRDWFIGVNSIASVFQDTGTAKTVFFIFLIGALVNAFNVYGGVKGIAILFTEKSNVVKNRFTAQILAQLAGLLLFLDATSSIVVSSIIGKPFFDKYNVPREKLAVISNSTGAPIAWLIPFGGAGALTASLINKSDILQNDGFSYVMSAVPYQFYTIIILVILTLSIVFGFDFKSMRKLDSPKLNKENIDFNSRLSSKVKPLARNMLLPIVFLLASIFAILFITGNGNLLRGDGSTAVFTSGLITLIVTGIYYRLQKITSISKYLETCFDGMKSLFEIVLILIMSFSFSHILRLLGTATYLSNIATFIPNAVIPMAVLWLATLISFSTGTSGGTVSILIPLMLPLAQNLGFHIPLIIGAIISGAVFGDQSSPISDSVILTSTATGVDIMSHVKTQLPYTTLALGLSSILYLIIGFII